MCVLLVYQFLRYLFIFVCLLKVWNSVFLFHFACLVRCFLLLLLAVVVVAVAETVAGFSGGGDVAVAVVVFCCWLSLLL